MTKQSKVEKYLNDMIAAFDARATYECAKNADNSNMQKTLSDLKASVSHAEIARLMLAANIDCNFINRAERANARFNVYSAEKVVNVIRATASVATLNHYTLNILRSIVACNAASVDFTQRDAVSACSLTAKVDNSKLSLISQYQKHVALNTAATQASSSLNALLMCAAIVEYRNAANMTCFKVAESEIAEKLKSTL